MNGDVLLIIVLVGLGTWMLRFGPTWLMRGTGDPQAPLSRFLAATGPTAIAALYVGGVLTMISPDLAAIAPLLAGSLAVVAAFFWRRDITVATLAGAVVYGAVFALF